MLAVSITIFVFAIAAIAAAPISRAGEAFSFNLLSGCESSETETAVVYFQHPATRFVLRPFGIIGANAAMVDDILAQEFDLVNKQFGGIMVLRGQNLVAIRINLATIDHKFKLNDFLIVTVDRKPFAMLSGSLQDTAHFTVDLHGCGTEHVSNKIISVLVANESRVLQHLETSGEIEIVGENLGCKSPTPRQIAKLRSIPETAMHPWRQSLHTFCNEIACFIPKNESLYLQTEVANREYDEIATSCPWNSLHRRWYPVDLESFPDYATMWFPEEWSEPDPYRESNRDAIADKFLQHFYDPFQYQCQEIATWGGNIKDGDGMYPVCMDGWDERWDPYESQFSDDKRCYVISIGVADDTSFEAEALKQGCVVHSFDPTVSGVSLKHEHMHFHRIGLSYKDYVDEKGTEYLSLDTIVTNFGPKNRDAQIALLKIDCEGCEHEVFHVLDKTRSNILSRVHLLVMEFHFGFGFEWDSISAVLDRHSAKTYMRSIPAYSLAARNHVYVRNVISPIFSPHFENTKYHKDTTVFAVYEIGFVLQI